MDDIRIARAYLACVAEPPAAALSAFIAARGPVEAAERIRTGDVPKPVADETSARRDNGNGQAVLEATLASGARLIIPEDPEWPSWPLLALSNAYARGLRWATPPIALWARGPTPLDDSLQRAVSVVGARAATTYGELLASEFGYGLAEAHTTVVSGAAHGIDGAAHRGALSAGGPTIAVLGCGIDRNYPAAHSRMLDRIATEGIVLSEYPGFTPPAKHRFLVRNRLIAGLSAGTVVVEAGARSGARNTASSAAALGKLVLAVPGPVSSAQSQGCHELIRANTATLATSVEDILEATGHLGLDLPEPTSTPTRPTDGLGDQALRVHEALSTRKPTTPEQVAANSGVPLDRVRALLPELELTGFATRKDEGWHRSTP